ncbi:unnamed protein product [Ectocarpus sp. 13 AM-2016]
MMTPGTFLSAEGSIAWRGTSSSSSKSPRSIDSESVRVFQTSWHIVKVGTSSCCVRQHRVLICCALSIQSDTRFQFSSSSFAGWVGGIPLFGGPREGSHVSACFITSMDGANRLTNGKMSVSVKVRTEMLRKAMIWGPVSVCVSFLSASTALKCVCVFVISIDRANRLIDEKSSVLVRLKTQTTSICHDLCVYLSCMEKGTNISSIFYGLNVGPRLTPIRRTLTASVDRSFARSRAGRHRQPLDKHPGST